MTPVLGIIASSNQQGRSAATGSYDALATTIVPSGGLASLQFVGIPAGYRHLQIRASMISSIAGAVVNMTINNTSTPYSRHRLVSSGGTTMNSFATTGASNICIFGDFTGTGATPNPASIVLDILDYASTTKNKTIRILTGTDRNGSGEIEMLSAQWFPTTPVPITSLQFTMGGSVSSFNQYTEFQLFGIK